MGGVGGVSLSNDAPQRAYHQLRNIRGSVTLRLSCSMNLARRSEEGLEEGLLRWRAWHSAWIYHNEPPLAIRFPSNMSIPEFLSPIQTLPVGMPDEQERANISEETIGCVTYDTVPDPYGEVPVIRRDFNVLERQQSHYSRTISMDGATTVTTRSEISIWTHIAMLSEKMFYRNRGN